MALIQEWVLKLPWDLIEEGAEENRVPKNLVGAIIQTESAGCRYAARFEPRWKYFYLVDNHASQLGITKETETVLQACSYGLMQIMGSVCRELGFQDHLTMLTDPVLNIKYGCMKLKKIAEKYHTQTDIISAYNAGTPVMTTGGNYRNQAYVTKVSSYLRDLELLK
jgi:soluble lytic murein transglycosylase-like protein